MKAKYYIFRNLTRNCFSVKYKGKVIAHCDTFIAKNAHTKVNKATRARVVHEKKKYVHAYVVCESIAIDECIPMHHTTELKYNPFKQSSFTLQNINCDLVGFSYIVGYDGKVFAMEI